LGEEGGEVIKMEDPSLTRKKRGGTMEKERAVVRGGEVFQPFNIGVRFDFLPVHKMGRDERR